VIRRLPAGRWRYARGLANGIRGQDGFFFILPIFRTMVLAGKSLQIFEFTGLICKIFRGKELGRSCSTVVAGGAPGSPLTTALTTAMRKGAGMFRAFFFDVICLLYQF